MKVSCDLLSKCIFDILNTMPNDYLQRILLLWFAFKMYLWHIKHNSGQGFSERNKLWFAFKMYLWHIKHNNLNIPFCSHTLWFAFKMYLWHIKHNCMVVRFKLLKLWFAFKMYLWHIKHNQVNKELESFSVVICFQNVSLTY